MSSSTPRARRPRARRVFTQEDTQEMIRLKEEGWSLESIGAQFSTSSPTIRKHLNESGVDTSRRRALFEDQRQAVVDAYSHGANVRELARRFSVSRDAVKRTIDDAGVERRTLSQEMTGRQAHNKRVFSPEELERIRVMWEEQGDTMESIACAFGLASETPVFRVIHEQGFRKFSPQEQRDRERGDLHERFQAYLKAGGGERLLELYHKGHSFAEIAQRVDFPYKVVRKELRRRGASDVGAQLSLEERKEILKAYGKHDDDRGPALVRRLGLQCTPTSVTNFARSRGIDTKLEFAFSTQDIDRMTELYGEGMGTTQIARVFSKERRQDIRFNVIRDRLHAAGVRMSAYSLFYQYQQPDGAVKMLRSAWERDVAVYLDHLQEKGEIVDWQYQSLEPIPYVLDGKTRSYTPDFYVTYAGGRSEIWEVKGKRFKGTDEKIREAKKIGFVVKIIDDTKMPEIWGTIFKPWDWDWLEELRRKS